MASTEDIHMHAAGRNSSDAQAEELEKAQLMAQWAEGEELLLDYAMAESGFAARALAAAALLLLGTGAAAKYGKGGSECLPKQSSHYV